MDLQEISDRMEIQDLITEYAHVVDRHEWAGLDDIFTPDADLDFTATGGERGDLPAIKAFFDRALNLFSAHQHLVATSRIRLDGDTATASTICHNPMILKTDDGESILFVGLWYHDTLVRTPAGWRISTRRQEKAYFSGL